MTDNDIIKGLLCCTFAEPCEDCPLEKDEMCVFTLKSNALDIINRQKAEIERLKEQFRYLDVECERLEKVNETAKAEAIKEFAERLKEQIYIKKDRLFYAEKIDNLVKEMVGDDNGNERN